MSSDIPPVYITEPAASFQKMRFFKTKQEAIEFIEKNHGILVQDMSGGKWIVIRIPTGDSSGK